MPIYEFFSPDTNKVYSFFARSFAHRDKIPRCPDKPGARMERVVSRFAVTGRAAEKKGPPVGAEDPRMERVMAEMQGEMAGIDENNPDPKALGRMMRKMTEATGQPMPKEMEQMIRRMEAGEDPEKLEEEFGEAFEGMEMPDEETVGEAGASRQAFRRPTKDPALYEMSEFV
ncbi:MAG: hypothetical protein WC003_14715 [Terrimicrobiaceae bacterium]